VPARLDAPGVLASEPNARSAFMRLGRGVKYKTLMSLVYDTINVLQLAHVAVRAPAQMHTPRAGHTLPSTCVVC
jgi:hypothetical protein